MIPGPPLLSGLVRVCLDVLWGFLEGPEGSWPVFPFSSDFSPYLSNCFSVFLELFKAPSSVFSCVYVSLGVVLLLGGPGVCCMGSVGRWTRMEVILGAACSGVGRRPTWGLWTEVRL